MAVLSTVNLTKDYPGCRALDSVTVAFESGKVNALLGKNGSGKSTLVKCFSGAIQPTSGSMLLNDKKISFTSPSIAVALPKDEPELQAAVNEAIGEAVSARLYFNWMNEAVELTNSMID